ncbi:hypothetical protein DXG03_009078 [Asterophora parasitica]|uniref:Uncharacterized protein n=1 Tax=Asterophora parasitica TaxID=117018 RepID=A0A9P7KDS1_9AGAR|nr:hypothetical protein DXG03_009078 [Asterophora parasitica]
MAAQSSYSSLILSADAGVDGRVVRFDRECIECLREGEEWQEKFTRGARRRRSLSLDTGDSHGRGSGGSGSHDVSAPHPHAVVFASDDEGDLGSPEIRPSAFALTVDEVDKRRKSQEFTDEELKRFRASSPSFSPSAPHATPAFHSPHAPYSGAPYPLPLASPLRRLEKEDSTSSATSSTSSTSSDLTAQAQELTLPPRRPKSSPIQEEDEDQLFPLPSPRRTPSNSPSPSANGSPAPSPNTSTSCLTPPGTGAGPSSSKESLAEESVLAGSFSRKPAGNGLLSPHRRPPAETQAPVSSMQPSALSVSLAPSSFSDRARSSTAPTPPSTLSSKPRPVPIAIPVPVHAQANSVPIPAKPLSTPSSSINKQKALPIPPNASAEPRTPTRATASPSTSPSTSRAALPLALSSSPSLSRSPPSSPLIGREKGEKGEKGRRPSFSLPALKDAIKGASVDVLRGVSNMSGGGAMSV